MKYCLLLLSIAASPCFAQDATPAADPAIVVTATRSGDAVEAEALPQWITLLDAETLDLRQVRIVSDVLRDVPGIAVNRSIGGLTDIRVRGSEANHVLVLIDGIEAADPFQGQYDFGTLIADEAARIEVLRGPQSALYGSDAIGGVIHYITLSGREAPGISVRAEGGTLGTLAGGARVAGVTGALDYALSASLYDTDGTPTAREGTRDIGYTGVGASAKLNWTPSETFTLSAVGRYSHTDADSNNTDSDPASPDFGLIVDSPGTGFRNEGIYGLVRGELSLAEGRWTTALTGQVAATERRGYTADVRDYGDRGTRLKGSLDSTLRLGDAALRHTLTGAVDYEREAFRNTTPSPFVFGGRRTTDNWGFVGQYELALGEALSLGGAIRHDVNDRFADATTWRAQAGYRLPMGLRLRGAYATGVKNPGYYELFGFSDGRYIGNPDLKPERSKSWEIGVDQAFADDRASIGVTYFRSRLEDEIFVTYPAPDFVATPANRDTRSRQQGIEVAAALRPVDQIRLDLAYSWIDSEENGVREVRRPRHIGSVNASVFSADRRGSATLSVRYNGRQDDLAYTDPSYIPVRVSLQEYVLVNLAAEYRLSDALSLFGRVENLFDEDYEEVFSFATPGRSAVGGIRARFR